MNLETVKAGRGAKVHLRHENYPTTICGQGLGTRGGRTAALYVVYVEADCTKCLEATS